MDEAIDVIFRQPEIGDAGFLTLEMFTEILLKGNREAMASAKLELPGEIFLITATNHVANCSISIAFKEWQRLGEYFPLFIDMESRRVASREMRLLVIPWLY